MDFLGPTTTTVTLDFRGETHYFLNSTEIGHVYTYFKALIKLTSIFKLIFQTIDMVNGTEPNDDLGKIDEDEELDDYLKMKMTDDSQKGSTNRSPKGPAGEPNKSGEGSKNSEFPCSGTICRVILMKGLILLIGVRIGIAVSKHLNDKNICQGTFFFSSNL